MPRLTATPVPRSATRETGAEAELDLRQPQEIELYGDAFEQLAAAASYGRAARAIINKVIEELAPEVPEDNA